MVNMEFLAKVQRNGIVVIPKNIRDLYGVEVGDMVKLDLTEKVKKPVIVTT
jgi:AbrB family looped-hinge helix DNA binding protein